MMIFNLNKLKTMENDFQTYEEFMAGVKRITPLPAKLRMKPIPNGYRKLTKHQAKKIIMGCKIKFKANRRGVKINNFDGPPTEDEFEKWWSSFS